MAYYQFEIEDGEPYGSFEVFEVTPKKDDQTGAPVFFWWTCFPGCMPDGDPCGPFETERAAIDDANME
jgi:hypothetical protein